jgi:maltose/moltooligosaccharide transporter
MNSHNVTKPKLSFWQIWNMSFGFFGIQFGWGLQMGNMSAIYQFLGAEESQLAYLWLAAPLTGFLVQPIIGYYSDRTWTKLGRRRPYFLIGAILASISLVLMPHCSALWMAAGLLWILDASVNISMEPFRAFVGDKLPPSQRNVGFAMQSLLIGAGAVIASALPFILKEFFGVSSEASATSAIPQTVHVAFHLGAAVFFLAVLYTVIMSKEDPPESMEEFQQMKAHGAGIGHAFREIILGVREMPGQMVRLSVVQFFTWFALFCMWIYFSPAVGKKIFHGEPLGEHKKSINEKLTQSSNEALLDQSYRVAISYDAWKKSRAENQAASTEPFSGKLMRMFGLKAAAAATNAVSAEDIIGLIDPPASVVINEKQATMTSEEKAKNPLVQTIAVALMDNPNRKEAAEKILERLTLARNYQAGTSWAGVCFSIYNLVAFVFAFALLAIAAKVSARSIHIVCLALGAAGLISAALATIATPLLLSMVGVGIAWASILSMPYAMLANVVDPKRMGFFMGVFNLFIVIPQIIAAVALGKLVESFLNNDSMNAVLMGGISLAIASFFCFFVKKQDTK